MSHPIMGTSLQDLNNMDRIDSISQQDLFKSNINTIPNTTLPTQQIYPNQYVGPETNSQPNYDPDIEDLVKSINENFPTENFTQLETEEVQKPETIKWYDNLSRIPSWIKEILLLVLIFIILSLPWVKDFIGKYINQINVDEEGKVPFSGVVIYGLILAIVYIIFKKLLIG